jgi:hypothetical protein
MFATLAFAAVAQHLEPTPFPVAAGSEVEVRAVDEHDRAVAGLAIEVELPDRSRRSLGITGTDGIVRFVPAEVGRYVYRAEYRGIALVAPQFAVPRPRRWLYGLACVPLGLALLWHHLRALRRARAPAT